jgi:uncharacterized alkaline shock family protein YloU
MDDLQSATGRSDTGQGKVTIAPSVLTTIVRLTALEQEGVHSLAPVPRPMRGLLTGSRADEGILLGVGDEGVSLELHVVAESDANMLKLGDTLQTEVTRAIEDMVGLHVRTVDVYIDDVFLPPATGSSHRGQIE